MDQTNPATGVQPAGIESALESSFGIAAPEPKKVVAPEPEPVLEQDPPADDASDEPTVDDLPEVEAKEAAPQSADDAEFEIVHAGKQVKLTRADLIKHAQQGFDYTIKTQALAEKERAITETLTRAQEMEQMQVALAPD